MYSSEPITLKKIEKRLQGTVTLPASKSISNRLLIINALSYGKVIINNLSNANDTQVLKRRIMSESQVIDVGDAGTAMRFMTAFCAVRGNDRIIQGTPRMHQRPIGPLVKALKGLGAEIEYMEQEGFPPLRFKSFKQITKEISVPGNISSQFITALLLIAPTLPMGLLLHVEGRFMSRPYVEMTIKLLQKCGVEVDYQDKRISVQHQEFQPTMLTVESDWSAASYWFAFAALTPESEIILPGLLEDSLQGDSQIIDIAEGWGVKSEFTPVGLQLTNINKKVDEQMIDFSNIPDLAQTVAVVHSLSGIKGKYIGLESLRIKETDRIKALQDELQKIGAILSEEGEYWVLTPSPEVPDKVEIETYHDHRMAMAFSAFASRMDVTIANRDVTKKSYPHFWDDLRSLNIEFI